MQVTRNAGFAALEAAEGGDIYYTQTPVEASALWRQSTSGGEPVKVLEGVVMRAFVVLERGIYYIDRPGRTSRLQFFDLTTRRSTIVAGDLGEARLGLTASPDGRTILYTRRDSAGRRLDAGGELSVRLRRRSPGRRLTDILVEP